MKKVRITAPPEPTPRGEVLSRDENDNALVMSRRDQIKVRMLVDAERQAKAAVDVATKGQAEARDALLALAVAYNAKTLEGLADDGSTFRVVKIAGHSDRINSTLLKSILGARAWNKLTSRTLDPALLNQAVQDGTLLPSHITRVTETTALKPHVKVTVTATNQAKEQGE